MSGVKKLFEEYVEVAAIVSGYLDEFNRLFNIEFSLVNAMQISVYTKKIAEARKRINRDLVGINKTVNSALRHFDSATVSAAKSLELRLKPFVGRAGKKTYEESAGGISILLGDLNSTFRPQITTLGLDGWVNELAEAHSTFRQLLTLRTKERAERPQYKLKTIRKQIDAVYRKMVERIDSYNIANNAKICTPFVKVLNSEIAYFNKQYRYRATIDIKRISVKPIPIQILDDDGHPVTPIPEVFYRDKKLVFTVDYELSYSNNSKPGTATVFVHGKGAYKGVKGISFNIKNKNEQQ
jgi:hypothetical protein